MLILDAYNVLHVTGVLPPELAGPDVAELALMCAASRRARRGVTLVCDGPRRLDAGGGKIGGVRVVYAGVGGDADSVIEEMIERSSSPRLLVVVSSDRRIQAAARRRRAKWLTSDAFLEELVVDLGRGGAGMPASAEEGAPDRSDDPDSDDTFMRRAMEEWRGRIEWDDLDMQKWLDEGDRPGG